MRQSELSLQRGKQCGRPRRKGVRQLERDELWTQRTHLSGTLRDGRIQATITGASFAASLNLATRGNTQRVTIVPESGGTDNR